MPATAGITKSFPGLLRSYLFFHFFHIFLSDMAHLGKVNEIYGKRIPKTPPQPARPFRAAWLPKDGLLEIAPRVCDFELFSRGEAGRQLDTGPALARHDRWNEPFGKARMANLFSLWPRRKPIGFLPGFQLP